MTLMNKGMDTDGYEINRMEVFADIAEFIKLNL